MRHQNPCTCAHAVATKYQKRISGPLLDRIDIACNADMRVGEIRQFCRLQDEGQSLMRSARSQLNLSAWAYHRIPKVALTIADLAGSEEIQSVHLAEALQYLPKLMMS